MARKIHLAVIGLVAWTAVNNARLLAVNRSSDATPALSLALLLLAPLTVLSIVVHVLGWRRNRRNWDNLDAGVALAEAAAVVGIIASLFV